jgi:hypothetical protein
LVIKNESIIKIETLFKEYKSYIQNKERSELVGFAKELSEYALIYQQLPDGADLVDISFKDDEKRFFHIMNELDNTTVFPLVLYIYKKVTDMEERRQILLSLESYIVRRTVCRLPTKNYNNLFTSILVELKQLETLSAEAFKTKLYSFEEDTNRFPENEEFERAFKHNQLINQYSKEILYCIALYQLNNTYTDNRRLNSSGFSVEHIMPKKWRTHWSLHSPTKEQEDLRDAKLLTLGNLSLVKGTLNSAMKNAAWDVKRQMLQSYSTLKQTTDFLHIHDWNEMEITNRSNNMFVLASEIWER